MSEWPAYPLEQLVIDGQISYGVVQPGRDSEQGVPIVRVKDVRKGIVDTSSPMRIDAEIAERHSRTTLQGGEILLSLVGTVGESAVAPSGLEGWNVARAIAVVRPQNISSRWLQLSFESPTIRSIIYSMLNTTVQATLNLSDLKRLPIPVPPLSVREGIEEVIGALDDKIAANLRVAHTADELQRTKFHSLLADAVQVPLSETAQFVNGKAFTKNATGFGRMVVRIAELNSGPGASTVYNDLDVEDRHIARPGDILFAWSGSLTLHRWSRDEAIVNQHIFKVIANPDYPPWLVFELIRHKLEEFRAVAADKATTMGHIQRRHLDEPVLVPPQAAVASCDPLMAGLWDRALKANEENLALASLRDTLLPQLMSGKLRVRDAEKVVEEAL